MSTSRSTRTGHPAPVVADVQRRCVVEGAHDASGLTLVELLVALMLSTVILSAAYTAVIVSVQSLHRSDISTQNIDTARVGIAAITRDLRGADTPNDAIAAFEVAAPDHVRFTTRVGITTELIHIDIRVRDDATMVLTRTPLTASASQDGLELDEDAATTRVVASDLADTAVFRFFAADDDEPLDDLEEAAQRHRIDLVEVSLIVASDGGVRARPTQLVTTVRTPNLSAGR